MQINMAILLFTGNFLGQYERNLMKDFKAQGVPFFLVHNMADKISLDPELGLEISEKYAVDVLDFSCWEIREFIAPHEQTALDNLVALIVKNMGPSPYQQKPMLEGLVQPNDTVVLVCPVDSEAPQGRLIPPQVQAIREVISKQAVAIVLQETQLEAYFERIRRSGEPRPTWVITDSQLFGKVEHLIPEDQPLTSFSILLARSKGDFAAYIKGTPTLSTLQAGDRVLLLEACSHHSTCEDIGRVKIPALLRKFTGVSIACDMVAGLDVPKRPISSYALVIQCGGCMITQRQQKARITEAVQAGVPVTNYGMAISYMNGAYQRAVTPFIL